MASPLVKLRLSRANLSVGMWAVACVLFVFSAGPVSARQSLPSGEKAGADVRDLIRSVEASSPYRFLYRDALLAGRTVPVGEEDPSVESVTEALRGLGLGVRVDNTRGQVLVFEQATPTTPRPRYSVSGDVVDASSGARLPFATVTWLDADGDLRGVAANESGSFEMTLPGGAEEQITVSYLGFESATLVVSVDDAPLSIAIRLQPKPVLGGEVIVAGTILHSDLDSTWQHLIRPGVLAPLGESSVFRSLQSLPSVSLTAALSDGISVRGSKSDGFQVLLDGLPIYSQTHMFGLFDAFNEDALQAVGLFYGVAPASYQAPPGGTMSFLTRTGSQEGFQGSLGASSTSTKATLEGPLARGRGSWLLSARKSYLGQVDWFGNQSLIAQGLDVGRETSVSQSGGTRPFQVLSGDADYFDVHGKVLLESRSGGRFTLTGYAGGDQTSQAASRQVRAQGGSVSQVANAGSRWGASVLGSRWQQALGDAGYLSVLGGVSHYYGEYLNDSVVEARRQNQGGGGPGELRLDSFANHNRLTQWRASPEATFSGRGTWSLGADLNFYEAVYSEKTSQRPNYELRRTSAQMDAFGGYASPRFGPIRYEVGLRSHYYSSGNYLKLSPRVDVRFGGEGILSGSLGYSRNHQFLHQLEVEPVQESAPDVWILSSDAESPGRVDYWTAGVYFRPLPDVFLQIEGYRKSYRNLRLHETASPDPVNLSLVRDLNNPWLTDVDGRARGLEFMLKHRTGPIVWTHGYTLSRMLYSSPAVFDGREFPVSWDRRHQYKGSADVTMGRLSATLGWFLASGVPNSLRYAQPSESERLPSFGRVDLGIQWRQQFGTRALTAGFSVYNLLDRSNVWYRQLLPQEVSGPPGSRVVESTIGVDVYDLGIHPSFELGWRF